MRRVADRMGMPVTVDLPGADREEPVEAVFADFLMLDEIFSPFRDDSAVSRIGRGELELSEAGPLVRQVEGLCRMFEKDTEGYFSAWFGGRFDPTGLVKGWAIDRACGLLERAGCASYLVDAGGDSRAKGASEQGEPWRVGIRHPVERLRVARVVRVVDMAVATSGTYEKGAHILDPHTGSEAAGLLSLTVIGPDIVTADVYATAAFAMGLERGLAFIESRRGYEAYAIEPDLVASWTSGFLKAAERGNTGP